MSSMMLLAALAASATPVDEVIQVNHRTLEQNLSLDQADLGHSLVVIEREQIAQFGQADINAILAQMVPGLFASGRNGRYDGSYYSLQGSRKQDILWLLDGNRLNNRLYGGIYLDSLNPNIIERIEVLKGSQGIVYGSSAIAGVINIVTRESMGEGQGELGLGGDTLNSHSVDGVVSGSVGEVDWILAGSYADSDGYQLWKDEQIHWTAADDVERGYQVANIGGKLRWLGSGDQQLTLLAQWNQGDLERLRPYATIDSNNDREEQIYTLDYQRPLSDNWKLQLKGYYHGWDSYYSRTDQTEDGQIIVMDDDSYWGFEDYGVKAIAQYQSGPLQDWLIGAELQRYSGEDEVMDFVSETESVQSLFAQYRPEFDDTQLAFGLRYSDVSDAGDSLNWSVSGQHQWVSQLSINASFGSGFRLPSAEELYSVEREGGLIGNPDLEPEQSLSANLGLLWSVGDWQWEPQLFWRQVEDLIGIDGNRYVNLDKEVETQGAELIGSWQGERWQVSGAVTYADSREKGQSQLAGVPQWLGQFDLDQQVTRRWRWGIQGQYTGKFTDKGVEVGDYWLWHLSTSYQWHQHKFSLRLENALDVDAKVSVFNPGSTAPEGHRQPIPTLGLPRNLQVSYRYQF